MLRPALLALSAALLVAPALAETETYGLSGFDEIDVSAGIAVNFSVAETYSVVAEFERGGPDDVRVEVDGDTLEIGRRNRNGWNWGGDRLRVTFTVTAPALTEIDASSGSTVTATGVDAEDFLIDASSGTSVRVDGRCGEVTIDASSGASVSAAKLRCERAEIDASSGAAISAYASEEASVDASSGASIRIDGGPAARTVDRSSGASVRFEEEAL